MSKPKPPQDPEKLLEKTLHLIAQDIRCIQALDENKQFDGEIAGRLVKYSDALLKQVKKAEDDDVDTRKKLAKMSTAELAQMAEDIAKQAKEKK